LSVQSAKLEDMHTLLSPLSFMCILIIWLQCKILELYFPALENGTVLLSMVFSLSAEQNEHVLLHGSDFTWLKILPPNILEYIVKLNITIVSDFWGVSGRAEVALFLNTFLIIFIWQLWTINITSLLAVVLSYNI
jgi:hypothetical protein